jgi:hypothetical protein
MFWPQANVLAAGMVAFSFAVIVVMTAIEKRVGRIGE